MRSSVLSLLLVPTLLTSCAYNGVIVRKESRPHPLYHSIGIEGVYSFIVRDTTGAMHRQMVTPEVFEMYAEGQTFNDLLPAAAVGEFKQTQPAAAPAPHRARRPASEPEPVPFPTPTRVAAAPPPEESSQSFRASELKRSSRSLTATMRTEVQHDTPPESDGMQQPHSMGVVTQEEAAAAAALGEAKKSEQAASRSSKAKKATKKSVKPWRETAPVVETAPPDQAAASSDATAKPVAAVETETAANPPPR